MQAVAHSPKFAKKVGIPQSVGKEYPRDELKKVVQDRFKNRR